MNPESLVDDNQGMVIALANSDYMGNVWKAVDSLRGKMDSQQRYELVVALAYSKLIALSEGFDLRTASSSQLTEQLREAVRSRADENIIMFVDDVLANCRSLESERGLFYLLETLPDDVDDLSEIVLHMPINSRGSLSEGTPETLINLAVELLDINPNEEVADFGTGTGTFLVKAATKRPCKLYYGCDTNTRAIGVARLRASLLDVETIIEQKDMFQTDRAFDKIFANYPFAYNARGFYEEKVRILEELRLFVPRFRSSDWLFNLSLVKSLKPQGRAIGIMAAGSCFNTADRDIRRYFAEEGLIESIITLPEGMFFPYSGISTRLIVISRGNEKIRMIDASEICERGRRLCTFSHENVDSIIALQNKDADNSTLISLDELRENDYSLDPARYLEEEIKVKNGRKLEDVIVKITRGAGVKAAELEDNISSEPTPYRYLLLANIADGQMDDNLPYLESISDPLRKYCATDGDLVLSKIGPHFRAAVVQTEEQESVLCTGNLYIITVDQDRFDPHYVQMYLSSSDGQAQLNRISVGTTMKSVSVKDLRQVQIPEIPLDAQKIIVEKRDMLRKEIDYHKTAIEKAQKQIFDLLDEA